MTKLAWFILSGCILNPIATACLFGMNKKTAADLAASLIHSTLVFILCGHVIGWW